MKKVRAFRAVALFLSSCVAILTSAEEPVPPSVVKDMTGAQHRVPDPGKRGTVLIFIGRDCPVSNAYAPEIGRLCRDFVPKGIAFLLVDADPTSHADDTAKHAREFRYPCPVAIDRGSTLAQATGVTVTPEVAVLTPDGAVFYRGRIDDRYTALGIRRDEPTTRDLRDALDALVAGKPVQAARTRAVGCILQLEDKRP